MGKREAGLTIFDVVADRIIVHSEPDFEMLYTWNESLTLQCFTAVNGTDRFEEIDVRALSDMPRCISDARKAAMQWAKDQSFVEHD